MDTYQKKVTFDDNGANDNGDTDPDVQKAIDKYNELAKYQAVSTNMKVTVPNGQYSFTNLPTIYNGKVVVKSYLTFISIEDFLKKLNTNDSKCTLKTIYRIIEST